jgi:PAS domain S-box-containing protein
MTGLNESTLSAIFSAMTEGVALHEIVCDSNGKPVDYRILEVNPAFERITGITRDKAAGALASILYQAGGPPYLDVYARVAATGKPEHFETEFAPMQKSFRISVFSPTRGQFATVFSDVTERKKSEQELAESREELEVSAEELHQQNEELLKAQDALHESEARYRTVADNTYDFEFWLDPSGRYLYASPSCERTTGHKPAEFLADPELRFNIAHPDDRELLRMHREDAERMLPGDLEYRIVRPDGDIRWISHICQPVFDAAGKFLGTRGSNRDITERKRTEEALRESEAKATALVKYAPTGIYEMDFRGPKFVTVNDAMCRILGYTREELFAFGPGALLDEESRTRFADRVRRQMAGESIAETAEYRVRKKDGSLIDAVLNVTLGIAGDPHRALIVAYDVTERKQAEAERARLLSEVQAEKERLLALVGSIRDEVWFADTQKHFALANPAAPREFALASHADVDIEKFAASLEVLRPDGSPRPVEEAPPLRALAGEIVTGQEEMIRTPATGEFRYREVSAAPVKDGKGNIIGSVSVVRDITERRRAEQALRQAHERLTLAQHSAGAGIWDWDMTTDKLEWSPELFALFGLDPARNPATFDVWRGAIHPEDRTIAGERIQNAIRDHTRLASEYRIVTTSGETHWIAALGDTVYDAGGRPLRMSGICIDVTARRQAEAALQESEERLRLATAASALGVFEWDVQADKAVFQNARMFEILGQRPDATPPSRAELVSRVVHPDDVTTFEMTLAKAMEPGQTLDAAFRIRRIGDRAVRWVEAHGRVEFDANRRPVRLLAMLADVTERKQAEEEIKLRIEELRVANEELERFNRLAVGRELRMVELKQEVNEFCRKAGLPPRYAADADKK